MALTDEYQYGGNEYKDAKDKLMERILGEDQYLLKKKIDEYDYYKNGIKQRTLTIIRKCIHFISTMFII